MSLFSKFPSVDQTNFGRFREFYRPYDVEIVPFFDKLGPNGANFASLTTDQQIDFLAGVTIQVTNAAGAIVNLSFADALIKWLTELNDIIVIRPNDTAAVAANKALFRLQALALYRILLQLITYTVCIQKDDFNTAKVPMDVVLKTVSAHIEEWSANIQQFKTKELDMVGFIGDDLKSEEQRVNNNGEATVKAKFLTMLKKIIQIIDSIP
jgi:hypothetical protein